MADGDGRGAVLGELVRSAGGNRELASQPFEQRSRDDC